MLAKLSLSLLAVAAVASAGGSVTICNDATDFCVSLDTVVAQPLDPIVSQPWEKSYGQRWFFNHDNTLYNLHSGFVLEAPVDASGNIIPNKGLYMAWPSGKSNQKWKIDDKGRLASLHDECMVVWGMDNKITIPHHPLVVQNATDDATWTVKSIFPKMWGGCPEAEGQSCSGAYNAGDDQTVFHL